MTISKHYFYTLRRRAITSFIKENGRVPTDAEINELENAFRTNYPSVDLVGVIGYELVSPQLYESSSVEAENENRVNLLDDMMTLNQQLNELVEVFENSYRGLYATVNRANVLLDNLETRADALLLNNSSADVFVSSVEETFDTQDVIDFSNSTVVVESDYCTVNRANYTLLDTTGIRIQTRVLANVGATQLEEYGKPKTLLEDDGDTWEQIIYTENKLGRVGVVVEFEFPSPKYIGDIKIYGVPIGSNKQLKLNVLYSLDGQVYTAAEPGDFVISTSEVLFSLAQEGVKKIQFLFLKDASDAESDRGYAYVFAFDSIRFYTNEYSDDAYSVLYAGPYSLYDFDGNPVYFTKATMEACVDEPEETSVLFFLSKDNVSWLPVDWNASGSSVVSFGDGTASIAAEYIDSSLGAGVLIAEPVALEEIDYASEAALNIYISADYADKVPISSIVLKRNVVTTPRQTILKAPTGWMLNATTNEYVTTVYINKLEGRSLNLGSGGVRINGSDITGVVMLAAGYSTIAIRDSNWIELTEEISSLSTLQQEDALYPYNHRYLIEGYDYPEDYVGEQLYSGVDEYFGCKMTYVSPEEFALLTPLDVNYYCSYTIESVDGAKYFKVKVNKSDSTWSSELYTVDWRTQSAETNMVYVKAILSSVGSKKTPVIHSYKVRVV
jgi:hypothetical protein